jgi:hypothetical protein
MPGGGQLALVCYGNQNIAINGNPQETKFYQAYKRLTHFSQENIRIPLDGPTNLVMDQPIRLRAKIPRHADLMTDLVFVFDLPAMYSQIYDFPQPFTFPEGAATPPGYVAGNTTRIPAFRWIHMIGAYLIDNLAIYVGGTRVQEFPGEWIATRATIDYPTEKYLKWRSMVGDVPELTDPEWGIYAYNSPNYPFSKGEYPINITDGAPSTPPREIRVPLPFWFTEDWGRALPLVALQLHEVEVQITLRPLQEVYRLMEPLYQAEPTRPYQMLSYDPEYPVQINPSVPAPPYDNLTLQNMYQTTTEQVAKLRYYFTTKGTPFALQDTFNINARLEGNYVYLSEREQVMFASRELSALVRQVQLFRFPNIQARSKLDLDIHGLTTRLVFWARRSDAIQYRNDYINLSNWKSLSQAPFIPAPGQPLPNSGLQVSQYYAPRDILVTARLLLAGIEIYEERPAKYFEHQTPMMTTTGTGVQGLNPGGIRPADVMGPIYQFPFALNGSDYFQPSGSLNTSRVKEIQLEVNPIQLDPQGFYTFDFTVYAENLNVLKFLNGMASMEWAI